MLNKIVSELQQKSEHKSDCKLINDFKEREDKSSKFRLQSRKIFLTYPAQIPKNSYIKWFSDKFFEPEFIRIANEIGHDVKDKENNCVQFPHSHVLIDAGKHKRFDIKDARALDFPQQYETRSGIRTDNLHGYYIKASPKKLDWINILKYISKLDKENGDLKIIAEDLENSSLSSESISAEDIWKCISKQEVIQYVIEETGTIKLVHAALEVFDLKPSPEKIFNASQEHLFPWQKTAWTLLHMNFQRFIIWIIGKNGGEGKTYLQQILRNEERNEYFIFNGAKKANNLTITLRKSNFTGHKFVCNLSKADDAENDELYRTLEIFSDGILDSDRYEGTVMDVNSTGVYVFANCEPNVHKMSKNRIQIYRIEHPSGLVPDDQVWHNEHVENPNPENA